jgi:hypothetical protein
MTEPWEIYFEATAADHRLFLEMIRPDQVAFDEAVLQARRAFDEAIAPHRRVYETATAPALQVYIKAVTETENTTERAVHWPSNSPDSQKDAIIPEIQPYTPDSNSDSHSQRAEKYV